MFLYWYTALLSANLAGVFVKKKKEMSDWSFKFLGAQTQHLGPYFKMYKKKFLQVAKKKKEALANVITIFKGIDDDADLPVIQ